MRTPQTPPDWIDIARAASILGASGADVCAAAKRASVRVDTTIDGRLIIRRGSLSILAAALEEKPAPERQPDPPPMPPERTLIRAVLGPRAFKPPGRRWR
jgi:hypothetical protein